FHRLLHQGDAHPLAITFLDYGTVVRPVDREPLPGGAAAPVAIGNPDPRDADRPQLASISIIETALFLHDGLGEEIHRIHSARRVHPAEPLIKALIDKELPPGGSTIGIETLI